MSLLTKIFGSRNQRLLKQYRKIVIEINKLEPEMEHLSDEELQAKTPYFKKRLADGEDLEDLLPEAFAVCREASKRVLKMRHFDVQLIGGMAIHQGKISEMGTGEGKTLVATLPAYLNALAGLGVHIVTVNDYLATRDSQTMGKLFNWLGLTTGVNLAHLEHQEKQAAYLCDITYGTNNEFGFDYLRDNMVYDASERVQRNLHFAIVDEVDSILIDEARTPLIISGQAENQTDLYYKLNEVPPLLDLQIGEETPDGKGKVEKPGDYIKDEKSHQIWLTEAGHEKVEKLLSQMGLLPEGSSLYEASHISLMHHLYAALKAHALYHKDQHYVVHEGEVVIVDEFTGRMMSGRRWSDGLHQAVEAKEKIEIQNENQTLASITFQNYFRMYQKLSGMTGTADTEAYEFQAIYDLETVVIPQNRPNIRIDRQDQVYKTAKEKYEAILKDVKDCFERGQPVLVGTTSIENSELVSEMLARAGLPHNVLNAKQHAREAEIIVQAGRSKVITIATNMAGRGTDIVLGGNVEAAITQLEADTGLMPTQRADKIKALRTEWEKLHQDVLAVGGLHIIGTERHESRRIDNQLRGRAARQGDPGSSRFYLALDDPLLRIFAGDRMRAIMDRLKMPEGEPIEAGLVSRAIESAQRKVEARNFDIRKQLLEYDDVANDQRKVIYEQRNNLLDLKDVSELTGALRDGVFTDLFRQYVPQDSLEEQWDISGLDAALIKEWQIDLNLSLALIEEDELSDEKLLNRVLDAARALYEAKVMLAGKESFMAFERSVMLQNIDLHWREHLSALDYLRQGIHLRGYAQKNPKQEYKREAFQLFAGMLDVVKHQVVQTVMRVQIQSAAEIEAVGEEPHTPENVHYQHPEFAANRDSEPLLTDDEVVTDEYANMNIGRNDPCPCGSGKKYKHCHGKLA
jgi:preprotein translocase subunit SecA